MESTNKTTDQGLSRQLNSSRAYHNIYYKLNDSVHRLYRWI